MTKEEAIQACKDGYKVSHEHWGEGVFLFWDGEKVMFMDRNGKAEKVIHALDRETGYIKMGKMKEDGKFMKTDQFKTGMVVKFRDGHVGVVLREVGNAIDQIVNLSDGCWTGISAFNNELKAEFDEGYDIMEIRQYSQPTFLFRDVFGKVLTDSSYKKAPEIIWTRQKSEKEKLNEVIVDLKRQLADAQKKIDKM